MVVGAREMERMDTGNLASIDICDRAVLFRETHERFAGLTRGGGEAARRCRHKDAYTRTSYSADFRWRRCCVLFIVGGPVRVGSMLST